MLQKFGEHIRGWFAGIVIAVIAVAFVAWGLEYYIDRDHGSKEAIATVNGQKITVNSFNQRYTQEQRQQEKALGRGLSEQEMLALKKMTLNQMISQAAVSQAVSKAGFSISLDQIKEYIEQMPQFQVNGRFSPQLLQNALYNLGYSSADQFFEVFKNDQLIQQLANGLRGSAFVLPGELQDLYGLWQQRRDFSFVMLPIAQLAKKVQPTPQQIEAYYSAHQAQFTIPAKVQLQYILLSRDALLKHAHVADSAVHNYYLSNQANFRVPASWKITRISASDKKSMAVIQAQLKAGHKLTQLAEHPQKNWQAVTQTITAVDIAPELVDVFKKLRVGQVSQPLATPGGYTIFELLASHPEHVRSFDDVKEQIKKMLISQQVDQKASQQSEQLSTIVFTNPTSLEPAAKQTGLPIQISPLLTRKGEQSGVFAQQPVLDAAFSDSVLKQGNNSNPISLKNGGVIVLRVAKSVPSSIKPLTVVRSSIIEALKKQTALREVGVHAFTLLSQLNKGQVITSLDWQQRKQATRTDPATAPEILATAFSTPVNQYQSVELDNGYALVHVTAIHKANWADASAKQKQGLERNLANMRGTNEFQIYVQGLLKAAKVEIKDKTLADSWRG